MSIDTYKPMDMLKQLTLEGEQWKEVANSQMRYMVSNLGRIAAMNYKRANRVEIMKPAKDANGYLRTMLLINGKYKTVKVHRVVAETWIVNEQNKEQVNHINHIREDNRVVNLEWVTFKENLQHMMNHGRQAQNNGSKNGMSIMTEEKVLEARSLYKPYVVMAKDLAKKYGISVGQMKCILRRKSWKQI